MVFVELMLLPFTYDPLTSTSNFGIGPPWHNTSLRKAVKYLHFKKMLTRMWVLNAGKKTVFRIIHFGIKFTKSNYKENKRNI